MMQKVADQLKEAIMKKKVFICTIIFLVLSVGMTYVVFNNEDPTAIQGWNWAEYTKADLVGETSSNGILTLSAYEPETELLPRINNWWLNFSMDMGDFYKRNPKIYAFYVLLLALSVSLTFTFEWERVRVKIFVR